MSVLVGKPAPDFTATAVVNGKDFDDQFTLSQFKGKKYVVLFFYPLDFTFVCPTEILDYQEHLAEFEKLNVQVIGCSVDSHFSHLAWLNTPKANGGIQGVTFPLVADLSKTIAMNYDVLAGSYDSEVDEQGNEITTFTGGALALRGSFLIDKNGIVQHQLINSPGLGRSVADMLRMVRALQHTEKYGEVCPANWDEGKDAMKPTTAGVAEYLATH